MNCSKCGWEAARSIWGFNSGEGSVCGECAADILGKKHDKCLKVIQMFVKEYYVPGRENRPEIEAALNLLKSESCGGCSYVGCEGCECAEIFK